MNEKQDFYLGQVRRLAGLDFPPTTPESWAELAKALRRSSGTQERAERIVSRFLDPGAPRECPKPGDITLMARTVPVDANLDRPDLPPACERCAENDWLPYVRVLRGVAYESVERCTCLRGQKLAALDAQRQQVPMTVGGPA